MTSRFWRWDVEVKSPFWLYLYHFWTQRRVTIDRSWQYTLHQPVSLSYNLKPLHWLHLFSSSSSFLQSKNCFISVFKCSWPRHPTGLPIGKTWRSKGRDKNRIDKLIYNKKKSASNKSSRITKFVRSESMHIGTFYSSDDHSFATRLRRVACVGIALHGNHDAGTVKLPDG